MMTQSGGAPPQAGSTHCQAQWTSRLARAALSPLPAPCSGGLPVSGVWECLPEAQSLPAPPPGGRKGDRQGGVTHRPLSVSGKQKHRSRAMSLGPLWRGAALSTGKSSPREKAPGVCIAMPAAHRTLCCQLWRVLSDSPLQKPLGILRSPTPWPRAIESPA